MKKNITTISISPETKAQLDDIKKWELGESGSWEELLKGFIEIYNKLQSGVITV